jgi:type I restriction enzyme S subunit
VTMTQLGDIASIVRGIAFPKEDKRAEPLPGHVACLRTTNVQRTVEWDDLWFVPEKHVKRDEQLVSSGDILISTANSYELVGKVAPVVGIPHKATLGAFISLIRPNERVEPKFLYHQLAWGKTQSRIRETASTTTNISNVSTKKLLTLELYTPSLEVQREIVAELEKQFSRLDEAVANLQRVKANLKRYKASVLKAAVEGRLVEAEASLARREGRTYETGEQLLHRILEERQARLAGKAKFKIPKKPSDSDLPELPEGWIWSSFEAVADRVTVGHVGSMKNEYVEKGVPFLRSQNVRPNRFDPEGLKYITDEFHASLAKSALSPGDIAVVRSGSVGVSCVIPNTLQVANCSDLVIIKAPRGVESHYGAYYLNSVVESRIAAGRVGVALVHFNTQSVAELPLPLPPIAEQQRIAAEVDRHLSIIREVEAEVDANLQRAQALRQATLSKAFQA